MDSGNLAGHLLTLRQGLLALADASILAPRCFEGLLDTAASRSAMPSLRGGAGVGLPLAAGDGCSAARSLLERWAVQAKAEPLGRQIEGALADLLHFRFPDDEGIPTARELAALNNESGRRARERIARARAPGARKRASWRAWSTASCSTRRASCSPSATTSPSSGATRATTTCSPRRRALSSFVAIAQGQLPQESWFALGRLLTTAGGEPALLSWSGSMFEYLMPLLVMPTYENTLLDRTCHAAVNRQIAYGRERGVPWGMSESGYNTVDAALNYQYRAFGVPGLGLKRGLAEDLVVAPYASALALMVAPEAACSNLQRLAAAGLEGRFGFYEAIDYTASRAAARARRSTRVVRSFMAHHQGMVLLSLAYLLLDRPMQRRFQADPRFQATMLLLQERVPRPSAFYLESAGRFDARAASSGPQMPMRVFTTPDTPIPEVQLLSNGRYHVMVTNAGGGYSRWKDLAVTRWREDATRDHWGSFCYLRDVASGEFWSSAHQPTLKPAQSYEAIFSEARAEFRRRDHDYETHTEIVVSPEDDIELRRVRITNRAATRAHDRGHQLRRSGARAAGGGRAASGLQQPVRADRDRARAAGDPLHAPAALARRARAVDVPPDGGARRARSTRSPTRPIARASSAAAAALRRAARACSDAALSGTRGLGARSDRRDPPPHHARAAADRRPSTWCPASARRARPASR